jgi:hypothetical protein
MHAHLIPDMEGGFVAVLASRGPSEAPKLLVYHVSQANIQDVGSGCSDAALALNRILTTQHGSVLFASGVSAQERLRCVEHALQL